MLTSQAIKQAITALKTHPHNLAETDTEVALAALTQQLVIAEQSTINLAGERRLVTVMFADISGFTAMSEKLDPEEVRNTINACFELLGEAIARYDGYIDKFIGDEIMALFGAPLAHENDPERALRAALDMMSALAEFNAEHAHKLPKPLALHFGINTGLAIAGGIGTADRQDYSVMGDTVNLAARLEGIGEAGDILVGATTYRLTAPLFEFDPLKPVMVKGKEKPVQVYRLLRAKAGIGGQVRGIEGLHSPMVGRSHEFIELQTLLKRLETRQGGVVSVIGEAGLGKSRLVNELRSLCQHKNRIIHWAKGRALSYAENASYLIARDVLRSLLGIAPDASSAQAGVRLQNELNAYTPNEMIDVYPYLAQLLEVPLDEETAHRLSYLDAQVIQQRIFKAVKIYLSALTAETPLVMVWDDLHWADPSSFALLNALLDLTLQKPLVHILIYRPAKQQPVWTFHETVRETLKENHVMLALKPISLAQSIELVDNLLGKQVLPEDTTQLIATKAEGNPFFIEEVLRSLINQGSVVPVDEGQKWHVAGDINNITIPDSLQGVVMARIDGLDPQVKRTLQIASILGRSFNVELLEKLIEE